MAQNISGFRAIFSHAWAYNLAQRMVGAEKARRMIVADYFPDQSDYRMLDIGCGTAEILRHLPHGIDYQGFDASEEYIEQARAQFGDRGQFHAELVREATLEQIEGFDLVLAFGLLHHLDDDEAARVFKLGHHALRPGGKLITIDPVYTEAQNPLARWIISKDRGQNIRTIDGYKSLAGQTFDNINASVRHDLLYMPYSHAIVECRP